MYTLLYSPYNIPSSSYIASGEFPRGHRLQDDTYIEGEEEEGDEEGTYTLY